MESLIDPQRQSLPPDLASALETVRRWSEQGCIRWLAREQERLLPNVLDIVATSAGSFNFNDALLVALQREGSIGEVASFEAGFDVLPTFVRVTDL